MNVKSIPELLPLRMVDLVEGLRPRMKALEVHDRATPEAGWEQYDQFCHKWQHLYSIAEFIELEDRMLEEFPWVDK